MLTIRYAACKKKVFKYRKVGNGRLWHCWKERIMEDFRVHADHEVRCRCGNLIGSDDRQWIKLRQSAFIRTGTITRR